MFGLSVVLFASFLPFVVLGAQSRSTPSSFQLYGYGDGLGGLPLFYSGGYAYLGDPSLMNDTDAATVTFSPGDDNAWLGSPNTTNSTNTPSWTNVTLFVPGDTMTDRRVGFLTNSSDSSVITTGFVFYGSTAMVKSSSGDLETIWSGVSLSDTGVHALYWNANGTGQVPITLRSQAPSNPSSRRR